MDTARWRKWFTSKVEIANQITTSQGRQSESDAEILLCCANSALAAQLWPGEQIDQKRFIELLIRFATPQLAVQKTSVPLLSNKLEDKGDHDSAIKLRAHFLPAMHALVIDGTVDQDEAAIANLLPALPLKVIRESSYAASIYTDLRCALIHEYQLSQYLEVECDSNRTDIPNYVNRHIINGEVDVEGMAKLHGISVPDALLALARPRKLLCFPYDYIRNVMMSAAMSAFAYWESTDTWEQPRPQKWWIEG